MTKYFSILLLACLCSCNSEPKSVTIALQPIGNFDKSLFDSVRVSIDEIYGFNIIENQTMALPKSAFIHVKSPRYRADSLLAILKREKPDSVDYVLGLIQKDMSTTKRNALGQVKEPKSKYQDWGVFGLGYRPGPSCVVSTHRFSNVRRDLFVERFRKICIHEIGHNLGLKHCDDHEKCVMRDAAETIKTVDQVDLWLCESCRRKIE